MNHIGDTNKMVDTPRTDEAWMYDSDNIKTVGVEFARTLERELNAATSEVERLRKANLQLREGAEEQKQRIKELEEVNEYLREKCLTLEYGRTSK